MMKVIQNSFTGGEISPAMYGRIDDQTGYQVGLAKCENFVVLPQGPVQNRAGFEFVRATKYPDKKCALIPFIFNTEQTMVLEFGEKYIRFHTEGATLLNADGTPYEVWTPYAANDVADIHYVQSADVITLVHPDYAPRELQRYSATDWRLTEIDFGEPISAPTGLQGTYTCTAKDDVVPAAMRTMYTIKYVVTALKETGVGDRADESSASSSVTIQGNLFVDGAKITLAWNAVSGATRYRVYKTYSGRYGYVGETETPQYVDTNIEPDESVTPPRYIEPFESTGGITSVTVTNGGSGYEQVLSGVKQPEALPSPKKMESGFNKSDNPRPLTYSDATTITSVSNTPFWTITYSGFSSAADAVYPPDADVKAQALKYIDFLDVGGGGSGAVVEPTLEFSHWVDDVENDGVVTYRAHTRASLTGAVVKNHGRGYQVPLLRAYWNPFIRWLRYDYYLSTYDAGPTVSVSDPVGKGAKLSAAVVDGKITGIAVERKGSGYVDPTITISASTGGGATAKATVAAGGDYPGAVTYYQQRRVFAGSYDRPQFVWMTRPGTESDMSNTLPSQDDNCIAVRVSVAETSRIRHVVPLSSLMVLTASAEIRVTSANDDVLTPTSIGFAPQTYYGAASPQPLLAGRNAIFASQRGGHVRALGYSYNKGGYDSDDLSIRAAHLFENKTVVSMALAKTPQPIVWCVTSDGVLLGCTFLADQNVIAWHKHTTVNGVFESVACVAEGDEDIVYCVVRRLVNGKVVRYLERMHERRFTSLEDCFFADSGVEYDGAYATEIGGLSHIEGQEVAILADGKVLPNQTVEGGKITLDDAAHHVIVGLPITASLETLPVILQDKEGGMGRGKMKNICNVFVRVYQSSGIEMGPSEDQMREYSHREREAYGTPPNVISREVGVLVPPEWSDGGQMYIRQKYPLPLTICALTGEVAT